MSKSRPQFNDPVRYPYTEGFWDGTAKGQLLAQKCLSCGALRCPPLPACYRCQSMEMGWQELPGTGTVFTFFWSHHPVMPVIAELGVYNVSVIELDGAVGDKLRFTSWVTDVMPETLEIGLRVKVHFDPVDETMALPIFRPL